MKNIFLFTHSFPFKTNTENFINPELIVASKIKNIKLTIIPLRKSFRRRTIPDEIFLNESLARINIGKKIKAFAGMIISNLFWGLPFIKEQAPTSIKDIINGYKYLYGAFLIKSFILDNKELFMGENIIYSYWFTHTPLGAILAKKSNPDLSYKIITRAHGFDVYEKDIGVYFPYRQLSMRYIDKIFTVSEIGNIVLRKRYAKYANKIETSHLGVLPIEVDRLANCNHISFVTCSAVDNNKRVNLIFELIAKYAQQNKNKTVEWTHYGTGPGFQDLKKMNDDNDCNNLKINLKGFVSNEIIRKDFGQINFDIFLNLSLSEGIPVSIMEAISAGIPVIATDVGGNGEIVKDETGILINVNPSEIEFARSVEVILTDKTLKTKAINFYEANFNANINFNNFYNKIINYK